MPRGGGLTEPKKLSDELADICGVDVHINILFLHIRIVCLKIIFFKNS